MRILDFNIGILEAQVCCVYQGFCTMCFAMYIHHMFYYYNISLLYGDS